MDDFILKEKYEELGKAHVAAIEDNFNLKKEIESLKAKLDEAVKVVERFEFAHDVGGKRTEYEGAYLDAREFLKRIKNE